MAQSVIQEILGTSLLEQSAAILSLVAIGLATRQFILSWPLDIISSVLYCLVFFNTRFYSDAMLQLVFIVMSVYGWYSWTHPAAKNSVEDFETANPERKNFIGNMPASLKGNNGTKGLEVRNKPARLEVRNKPACLEVRNITNLEIGISLAFTALYTSIGGYLLAEHTAATLPYADSLCTALSISASWLATTKVFQNWHIWIFADCIYVLLFINKHLYPTAILYFVLIILAISGLLSWNKSMKNYASA